MVVLGAIALLSYFCPYVSWWHRETTLDWCRRGRLLVEQMRMVKVWKATLSKPGSATDAQKSLSRFRSNWGKRGEGARGTGKDSDFVEIIWDEAELHQKAIGYNKLHMWNGCRVSSRIHFFFIFSLSLSLSSFGASANHSWHVQSCSELQNWAGLSNEVMCAGSWIYFLYFNQENHIEIVLAKPVKKTSWFM